MFLLAFVLWSSLTTRSLAILTEAENGQSTTEAPKSEIAKREQPVEAQRRDHSFNTDGTVNYHGSGSGHDSGDLVPPPGGSVFNSPSVELSVGHSASSGPGLSNSYGAPLPSDLYGPPSGGFDVKPPSVYGPPSQQYGPPPGNKYHSPPPKPVYGPPKPQYRPPSPPKPVYGPPSGPQFGPPRPTYSAPKPRPKPSFGSRPKPSFGSSGFSHATLLSPVSSIKPQYGPPKISATYGTPLQPSTSYGVPRHPKHGHGKTPPTPPVVKYDGWKPIPGLISNAPSPSYGVPDGHGPSGGFGFSSHGSGFDGGSSGPGISFGSHGPPSSSYGAPSFGGSSFGSTGFGIQLKPVSTYGPPPKPSSSYGTPLAPSISYGPPSKGPSKGSFLKPPSSSYGPPSQSYGSPKPPSIVYGVPQVSSSYGPPKPPTNSYGPPKFPSISYRPPKPTGSYGPPRPPSSSYGPPKRPSSSYGPPKPPSISYGPPKSPSSSYGPPKPPSSSYGPPSIPISSYGPPSFGSFKPPSSSYGPPKPPSSSYGPPKPPSSSYGPPKPPSNSYGPPPIFTTYSIPKPGISVSVTPSTAYRGPPVPHPLQPPSTYGAPAFSGGLYKTPLPPNALYGVPTGPAGFSGPSNTYGVPSVDIHAPVPSIEIGAQSFLSTGPAFPSQSYGAPTPASIHHAPDSTYGAPTALPLRQPKNPVKFRPPVPAGLISSIGAKWGDSAVWGGNVHSHKFQGNTYIPPAVPDPDPGIHANQGNPLVIPPPSAPPINYGPPSGGQLVHEVHHQSSHQSSGAGDLNPPPPPSSHGQSSFDIQQSPSVELSSSNNLDHHGGGQLGGGHHGENHQLSSGGVTSYNAPIDTSHHDSSASIGGQSFGGGIENIQVKGNQGSYSFQIQPTGGNSGDHVPHGEVLSNGLLQDIISAIENPTATSGHLQQYANQQSSDPVASEIGLNILKQLGGGGHAQQSNSIQLQSQYGSDLGHASSNIVPIYTRTGSNEIQATETRSSNLTDLTAASSDNKIARFLNKNQIALYYHNQEGIEERKGDAKDVVLVQMVLPNNSTSSQQQPQNPDFGALVSIKLQNAQNGVDNAEALKSAEKKR